MRLGSLVLGLLLLLGLPRGALAQSTGGLAVVGQLGGPALVVAAEPGRVYAAFGPRVLLFDVGDPTRPALLGQSPALGGEPSRLVADGPRVYALFRSGVAVLDVSVPAEPRVLATIAAAATDLAVVGDRLYLAGPVLSVFDVSSPTQPRLVAQSPALAGQRLAVVGATAYVHERITVRVGDAVRRPAVLRVGDVADPAAPRLLAELTIDALDPRDSIAVAIADGRAYLVDASTTITVVGVADPARPVLMGQRMFSDFFIADFELAGRYAYASNRVAGVRIYDLADPTQLVVLADYDSPGSALDVEVVGGHAYVADYSSGLRVVTIDAPSAPREVGSYGVTLRSADALAVAGDRAYVLSGIWQSTGLHVVDVSDPSAPRLIGFHHLPETEVVADVAVAGMRAYVTTWGGGTDRLRILDVADPAAMRELGAIDFTRFGRGSSISVAGSYAYLVSLLELHVVDVSDPSAPRLLTSFQPPGQPNNLVAAPPYLYVTESVDYVQDGSGPYLSPRGGGLRIYDVANPAAPRDVAFLALTRERSAYGIALLDPRTVLVGDEHLAAIDVSDPTQPRRVGTYAGRFYSVAAESSFALIARSYGDVELLSLARPSCPAPLGRSTLPEATRDLALVGGYGYAAGGSSGLVVLRATGEPPGSCRSRLLLVPRERS